MKVLKIRKIESLKTPEKSEELPRLLLNLNCYNTASGRFNLGSPKLKNDGSYLFLAERKSFATVNTLVVSPGAQRGHVIM